MKVIPFKYPLVGWSLRIDEHNCQLGLFNGIKFNSILYNSLMIKKYFFKGIIAILISWVY